MPELRWTLLLLGALFIAVLAWSERRKARQSTRSGHDAGIAEAPVSRTQREPTIRESTLRESPLTLPELRARDSGPPQDLPVVHVEDESLVGLRLDGRRREEGMIPPLEPPEGADAASGRMGAGWDASSASDRVGAAWDASSAPDPSVPDLPVLEAADTSSEAAFNSEVFGSGTEPEDAASSPDGVPSLQPEVPAPSPERAASLQPEQAAASGPREGAAPSPQSSGSAPSVDWPPEEDRRIIALRIVSVSPERFSGRAIRTALAAEGFVHGKFSIFHKPDAQHRAVLSAASLSKPGMFDLETIDSQRFAGLNLFAVLSGSQPAREPFEMLLACARNLNERLEGGLQDDRGGPLTPSRIAALRESLGAAPAPPS
jgi:FtsZ-interacting cell division protein ZipA